MQLDRFMIACICGILRGMLGISCVYAGESVVPPNESAAGFLTLSPNSPRPVSRVDQNKLATTSSAYTIQAGVSATSAASARQTSSSPARTTTSVPMVDPVILGPGKIMTYWCGVTPCAEAAALEDVVCLTIPQQPSVCVYRTRNVNVSATKEDMASVIMARMAGKSSANLSVAPPPEPILNAMGIEIPDVDRTAMENCVMYHPEHSLRVRCGNYYATYDKAKRIIKGTCLGERGAVYACVPPIRAIAPDTHEFRKAFREQSDASKQNSAQ